MQTMISALIAPEDSGKNLFVHYSENQTGGGYATLNDGQKVEYEGGKIRL
jgi:CspA family cold shock protein